MTLLAKVLKRLEQENEGHDNGKQFRLLKLLLTSNQGEIPYRETATQLGMEETAVRVAVHRLRKRYRQSPRDEISQTLSNPADLEAEIKALFHAF